MVTRILLLAIALLAPLFAGAEETTPGLAIEVRIEPASPYVQQEVRLTVTLFRRSSLESGVFLTPEVPNAVVVPLSESAPREILRDGEALQMIEKRFLLIPQRSGRLAVPAPVFTGRAAYARGRPLDLDVRPRAAGTGSGWWLPARSLTLEDSWRLPDPPYRVGDQLERTVVLKAEGLTGAQLPPLALPDGPGIAARRLAAEVGGSTAGDRLVGRRVERHLILLESPGSAPIPPLRIAWWDVTVDQRRTTTIDGRTFSVTAAPVSTTKAAPSSPRSEEPSTGSDHPGKRRYRDVVGAAAVVLLIGVLLWVSDRLIGSDRWRQSRTEAAILRHLRLACRQNDPRRARSAVIAWIRTFRPDRPPGLQQLAREVAPGPVADALRGLDAALYGPSPKPAWDGAAFRRLVLPILMRSPPLKPVRISGGLPKLHP